MFLVVSRLKFLFLLDFMIVHDRTGKKNNFHAKIFSTPLHPSQPEAPEHLKITVSRCFSSEILVSREFFNQYVKTILNNNFYEKKITHPQPAPLPGPPNTSKSASSTVSRHLICLIDHI